MGENTGGEIRDGEIVRTKKFEGDWKILPRWSSNRIALLFHERTPTGRELGGVHIEKFPPKRWLSEHRFVSRASIVKVPVEGEF